MDDNTSHHIKKEDITYEACMKKAKNYFSKTDMASGSKSHYLVAKENNWLKDYTWFAGNEKWGSDAFLIYAYEDHENRCVYVGLTKDLKSRRRQHKRKHPKTHEYDVVKKYFDLLGQDLLEEVILEEHLTPAMAQEREGFWLQKYLSEGWTVLNIAKTGSGTSSVGNYTIKWTKEKCLCEAKECKTLRVFMTQHNGAYQASLRNGWLSDFDWLERKDRKKNNKKINFFLLFFFVFCTIYIANKNQFIHSMTQMLHNMKQYSRPVDSRRTDLAIAVLCGSCFKGNEWYEAPGVEGEVGVMRT